MLIQRKLPCAWNARLATTDPPDVVNYATTEMGLMGTNMDADKLPSDTIR